MCVCVCVCVSKYTVYTVEPPNKGHYGANDLSLVERSSLYQRVPISEGPLLKAQLYTRGALATSIIVAYCFGMFESPKV